MNSPRTFHRLALAPFLLAPVITGCSDGDERIRRGAGTADSVEVSPYDAEHPSWKMHPGVLLVQREDESLVYDVELLDAKLVVPTASYGPFLARIVAGRTILVSRENEKNPLKNPGFIRRVLKVVTNGATTEIETEPMYLADIVRGHIDSTADVPERVAESTGATTQSEGLSLSAIGGRVTPLSFDKDIDVDLLAGGGYRTGETLQTRLFVATGEKKVTSALWLEDADAKARFKGHVHVAPVIDFALDVDVDIDWSWTGPSVDIEVRRARLGVGVEYEATGDLDVALNGTLGMAFDQDLVASPNLFPGCTIGGVPCGVNIEASLSCTGALGGSARFQTKDAKVFGTPLIGAEYADGKVHALASSPFQSTAPVLVPGVAPLAALPLAKFDGATKLAFGGGGHVECRVRAKPMVYVGAKKKYGSFEFDARLGVWATVAPSLRFADNVCMTYEPASKKFAVVGGNAGVSLSLLPEAAVFGRLRGEVGNSKKLGDLTDLGRGSFDAIISLGKGWTLWNAGIGSDPNAAIDCSSYL